MELVATLEEMKVVWSKYKSLQTNPEFVKIKDTRKDQLTLKEKTNE